MEASWCLTQCMVEHHKVTIHLPAPQEAAQPAGAFGPGAASGSQVLTGVMPSEDDIRQASEFFDKGVQFT